MILKNVVLPGLIISSILLFSFGCSEKEEPAVAPGSTLKADDALKEAEAKLEAAGISLSFDEPGALMHPENLIPDPGDLAYAEKQSDLEEAIDQLNIALAELEQEGQAGPLGSVSDRALVHLHLGFIYFFDAISRLLISDDPAITFIIGQNATAPCAGWYTFDISPVVHAKLDPAKDPVEYPLTLTVKERQAILDAADLIDDAIVKPRASDIQPQLSSVDRPPYSKYAIWHFQKATSLFGQYKPDVRDALEDFNECLEDLRSDFQSKLETWGFSYTVPPWR